MVCAPSHWREGHTAADAMGAVLVDDSDDCGKVTAADCAAVRGDGQDVDAMAKQAGAIKPTSGISHAATALAKTVDRLPPGTHWFVVETHQCPKRVEFALVQSVVKGVKHEAS